MGAQIKKKNESYLKILGNARVNHSNIRTENLKILGTNI